MTENFTVVIAIAFVILISITAIVVLAGGISL